MDIRLGDCRDILPDLPDESVQLILTSPPYANNRTKQYGGVPIEQYVEWFIPIGLELKRVLKPSGSFVLNVKERAHNGERATYILELILELRKQGWFWVEEYIWHKKNCYPGRWPNRFRDAWERCLHFTKQKQFDMYQDEVMVPIGEWATDRLRYGSRNDNTRHESQALSGFAKRVSNWIGRDMVYPTNVLHMATECANTGHPAAFPTSLASWFIELFTKPGQLVLDPFLGSGTTALACMDLGRACIGMELMEDYYRVALDRIGDTQAAAHRASRKRKSGLTIDRGHGTN
jgi:site-specific DNA-methyltransferase (adenine-specific)